jgi:hypothetical protein
MYTVRLVAPHTCQAGVFALHKHALHAERKVTVASMQPRLCSTSNRSQCYQQLPTAVVKPILRLWLALWCPHSLLGGASTYQVVVPKPTVNLCIVGSDLADNHVGAQRHIRCTSAEAACWG